MKNPCHFLSGILLSLLLLSSCGTEAGKEKTLAAKDSIAEIPLPKLIPYVDHGLYGYADSSGKIIVPCQYDYVSQLHAGYGYAEKEKNYALIDSTGKILTGFSYTNMGINFHGLIEVSKNELRGAINTEGKEIVPCEFDDLEICGNFICVLKGKKSGVFNRYGKAILPVQNEEVYADLSVNLVRVKINGKYGCMNSRGEMVIPANYQQLGDIRDVSNEPGSIDLSGLISLMGVKERPSFPQLFGLLGYGNLVQFKSGGKWGLLDTLGRELLPAKYSKINIWSDGYATITNGDKNGMVNSKGEIIIPAEFTDLGYFNDGLTCGNKNGKWFVFDSLGKELPFHPPSDIRFNKGLSVCDSAGKSGLINKQGHFVLPPIYDEIENESYNGYYLAKTGSHYSVIDTTGKKRYTFTDASPSLIYNEAGIIAFERNNLQGLCNLDGKEILPAQYDSIYEYSGYYILEKDGMKGLASINGKLLTDTLYSEIFTSSHLFLARKDKLFAVFDENGKRKSDFIYSPGDYGFLPGENGLQLVYEYGERFYVDFRGREYRAKEVVAPPAE